MSIICEWNGGYEKLSQFNEDIFLKLNCETFYKIFPWKLSVRKFSEGFSINLSI